MRGFDWWSNRLHPTTRSEDTTEKVLLGRLGSAATTVGFVVREVVGGFTHPRGLSISSLNELSKSLLFAIIRPLQRKL